MDDVAPSYQSLPVLTCYHRNVQQMRRVYDQRAHDVGDGMFFPLAAGGCGPTFDVVLKRLAFVRGSPTVTCALLAFIQCA